MSRGHIGSLLWLTFILQSPVNASMCSKFEEYLFLPGRSCGLSEAIKEIYVSPEEVIDNATLTCALIVPGQTEKWMKYLKEHEKPSKISKRLKT